MRPYSFIYFTLQSVYRSCITILHGAVLTNFSHSLNSEDLWTFHVYAKQGEMCIKSSTKFLLHQLCCRIFQYPVRLRILQRSWHRRHRSRCGGLRLISRPLGGREEAQSTPTNYTLKTSSSVALTVTRWRHRDRMSAAAAFRTQWSICNRTPSIGPTSALGTLPAKDPDLRQRFSVWERQVNYGREISEGGQLTAPKLFFASWQQGRVIGKTWL